MNKFTAADMRYVQRDTTQRLIKKNPDSVFKGLKYILIGGLIVIAICALGA